ncbi:hypothetical protein XENTR_v10006435 [Xenopus tropicalis]|nr:hypothetical protein XENTR_v10006435 [Xenopus tropicalis]
MIASTGSSGLYKAPLSKGLLLIPSFLSIVLTFLFQQQQELFLYNIKAIKDDFHSFLLVAWILSAVFDFLLVEAVHFILGATLTTLPSGFLAPVFALFVPFYCSVPRVQLAEILGLFPITNKTLVYIVGLQLLTSSPYMLIVAISGLISGLFYTWDVLNVRKILCIPHWLADLFSRRLEPIFSSVEPVNEARVGMGATVDIQRQQRIELLDQQFMLSQLAHLGRRQPQQGGILNWNRLFQPLRHRNLGNQAQPQDPSPATSEEHEPRNHKTKIY